MRYTVVQGDCLASIARRFGFSDYRSIYEHPSNAALREKRPNPNLIYPGDIVMVPEKEPKQVTRDTGATHTFRLRRAPTRVRITLTDLEEEPLDGVAYVLRVDGATHEGRTSGGLIDHEIPGEAMNAVLEIEAHGVTKVLRLGALDPIDTVSGIQGRLRNLGYDCGPIDGINGPKTKAGIRSFQRNNPPLVVDGVCGPKTKAVLLTKYGC